MAARNSYITAELDFAEGQLASWRTYIEENPIDKVEDRWGEKRGARGAVTSVVTANREAQIKCIRETTANYLQLLEVINKLRETETKKAKTETRGDQELNPLESGEIDDG